MKRRLWVPLVAVGLALLILVPTTFAVGEPGTTLYAQLGTNRFPAGQGAADASLTFNGERDIVLRIAIAGPAGTNQRRPGLRRRHVRRPRRVGDQPHADRRSERPVPRGRLEQRPEHDPVNQLDVDRIRSELAGNPNETFALMVARLINGVNYRTCTSFRTTPFPPLTTTSATTTPTTTGTSTTRRSSRRGRHDDRQSDVHVDTDRAGDDPGDLDADEHGALDRDVGSDDHIVDGHLDGHGVCTTATQTLTSPRSCRPALDGPRRSRPRPGVATTDHLDRARDEPIAGDDHRSPGRRRR